jgi:hypothetical protein
MGVLKFSKPYDYHSLVASLATPLVKVASLPNALPANPDPPE